MTTKTDTDRMAASVGVPHSVAESALVTYRSVGIGLFGVVMRYANMPMEKIALYMNSRWPVCPMQSCWKGECRCLVSAVQYNGICLSVR